MDADTARLLDATIARDLFSLHVRYMDDLGGFHDKFESGMEPIYMAAPNVWYLVPSYSQHFSSDVRGMLHARGLSTGTSCLVDLNSTQHKLWHQAFVLKEDGEMFSGEGKSEGEAVAWATLQYLVERKEAA